ncbi:Rrf2 family transcriptional regulator, partial [Bacillus velezensis]
ECLDSQKNFCIISPVCNLKNLLNEALQAYPAVLDKYTLRDLVKNKE